MQHAQLNYRMLGLGAALLVVLVFAGKSSFSEGVSARGKSGGILTDNLSGPCDPQLGQAELMNGTDVNGNPVTPADLAGGPVPLRGQIEVPLQAKPGRAPAYIAVDGSKLDPLLNPQSSCK